MKQIFLLTERATIHGGLCYAIYLCDDQVRLDVKFATGFERLKWKEISVSIQDMKAIKPNYEELLAETNDEKVVKRMMRDAPKLETKEIPDDAYARLLQRARETLTAQEMAKKARVDFAKSATTILPADALLSFPR